MLHNLREHYNKGELLESQIPKNPFDLFHEWISAVIESGNKEPNAMCLSTINSENKPSSRIVLLKELTDKGFVFYTNYHSRKGKEMDENPFVALNFVWLEMERQVRIEGRIEKIDPIISKIYFDSRPFESRIGAWASPQSETTTREKMESLFEFYKEKYKDGNVPLPDYWGGYLVVPDLIEFWQGRASRLHDRIEYSRTEINPDWITRRLGA